MGARTGADVATGCVEVLTGQLFAGGLHLLVGDEHRQGREDDAANCEQKRDAHQTEPRRGEGPGPLGEQRTDDDAPADTFAEDGVLVRA